MKDPIRRDLERFGELFKAGPTATIPSAGKWWRELRDTETRVHVVRHEVSEAVSADMPEKSRNVLHRVDDELVRALEALASATKDLMLLEAKPTGGRS